ncbi:MAG: MFS transporter, partial [Pseudomonadota bacterium]
MHDQHQNDVEDGVSRYYGNKAALGAKTSGDPRMWAAFGLFFILAFAFASWLPRLPELKRAFGMSEGDIGFVLLAMPVAQLCVIPLVAYGSMRLRLRTLNLICITWLLVAIALIGLATGPISLAAVIFLIGAGAGSTGVAINAAGFAAEEAMERPILSRCHAMYSVGLAAGGLTAGFIAAAGVPIIVHLAMTNFLLFVVLLVIVRAVVDPRKAEDDAPKFAWPKGALVIPGLIAMGCLMAEGVSVDWSSIYLAEVIDAPAALVGAGVAAFSGAMAVMRFAGDWISERLSPRLIVGGGAALSAAGYGVTAAAPNAPVA